MLISTRGRYALRVMIELATNPGEGYLPLKEITARQDISEKYLESILSVLVKAGFVVGLRGKGGGYRLSKAPSDYTVGRILTLTEGSLAPVACLEDADHICARSDCCPTLPMWQKLDQLISDYFEGITLEDLAKEARNGPGGACVGRI